jgi:hypothetical protein
VNFRALIPWRGLAAALWLTFWSGSLPAELSSDDYRAGQSIQNGAERARARAQIEAERRREAERAEEQARERAVEQARLAAALAAQAARRPSGAILTEARCGACHALDSMAMVRHTSLGWRLTVLRMRYLNGAEISAQDADVIVDYLTQTQGADQSQALLEYGLPGVVLAALASWALYGMRRRWRNRGGAAGA